MVKITRSTAQISEKKSLYTVLGIVLLCAFLLPAFAQEELEEEAGQPCPKPYIKTISPRTTQPLTEVRIRGSRFGHELGTVTFSPGVTGKIVSWSNKRISVEVPGDAQTGPVTVISSCGAVSNDQYFTVEGNTEE